MGSRLAVMSLALALASTPAGADDRWSFTGGAEGGIAYVSSPFTSWLDEGEGKLRFDENDNGLVLSRVYAQLRGNLAQTVALHAVVSAQNDGDDTLDATELYAEWRPVPTSPWRVRSRAGVFYPRLSLENVTAAWSSPYALTASAINTWIGEELRTAGAEVRIGRDLPFFQMEQSLSVEGAVFYANDPAGALLNWRGWSLHDRQTGFLSSLPLPATPAIEPWLPVPAPAGGLKPFEEIDHNPGFYAGLDWRAGPLRLTAYHYDNHGDPEARSGNDYAWQTRFSHLALQLTLPGDVGLLAQWLDGITRMGPDLGPWHVWDSSFDARYVLLTRAFGRQRLSLRWDEFQVTPYNDPDGWTNHDDGQAWTASYLVDLKPGLRLGLEYLGINTAHCDTNACAWTMAGLPRTSRQDLVQVSLAWQFNATF
jgi:hypothetical protein